jgi:hypothetical protein
MSQLIVYACGTQVKIKNIDLRGYITGISIRENMILYEVSYFMNNSRYSHWFYEYELDFNTNEKLEVGFR